MVNHMIFDRYLALVKQNEPPTIENKVRYLKYILKSAPELTIEQVSEFLLSLKNKGLSPNYLNKIVNTVKDYGNYQESLGKSFDQEIYKIKWFKTDQAVRSIFTLEETEVFLSYPFKKFYWQVFWNLLATTGARPGEIASLTTNDISLATHHFYIKKTKTGLPRTLTIPTHLLPMVTRLLKETGEGRLFPTVNAKSWGWNFRHIVKTQGLEKRPGLTVYSFRGRHLSALANNDLNIYKIKKIAGHKHIQSTEPYIFLDEGFLETAILKDPLNRKYASPEIILEDFKNAIMRFHLEENPGFDYFIKASDDRILVKVQIKAGSLSGVASKKLLKVGE